jgi:hypothetical protein
MATKIRGTQSLIGSVGRCFERPSVIGLELLWRWSFGLPALLLSYHTLKQILASAPLEALGYDRLTWLDLWGSAAILANIGDWLRAPILAAFLRLAPCLALAWIVLAAIGRNAVLRRWDRSLPWRPVSLLALSALRLASVAAICWLWELGVQSAAKSAFANATDPDLLAYIVRVICLTLGLFSLWLFISWPLTIAPLLVLAERRSAGSALLRSLRLGRELSSKLMEVNLVMGIVTLALIVLALVLSSFPLPFQTVLTPEYIYWWNIGSIALFFAASDLFELARAINFLELWQAYSTDKVIKLT